MIEVALLLGIAHRVANRRRRQSEQMPLGDRAAARRLGGLHVRLDHGFEHAAFAVGERSGHRVSVCIVSSLTKESNLNHPSGVHLRLPSLTVIQPWAVRGGGER